MKFSNYVIFVDESGDHGLTSIDRDFPVFALDFCIFEKGHYSHTVVPLVQDFKFRHFGHDTVVLHEHEIRKQSAPFVFLKSETLRAEFMEGLNEIVQASDFTIVAAVIHKQRLVLHYARPNNPYEIALLFCMELNWSFAGSAMAPTGGDRCRALRSSSRTRGPTPWAYSWPI